MTNLITYGNKFFYKKSNNKNNKDKLDIRYNQIRLPMVTKSVTKIKYIRQNEWLNLLIKLVTKIN